MMLALRQLRGVRHHSAGLMVRLSTKASHPAARPLPQAVSHPPDPSVPILSPGGGELEGHETKEELAADLAGYRARTAQEPFDRKLERFRKHVGDGGVKVDQRGEREVVFRDRTAPRADELRVYVNDQPVNVRAGSTVLQACEKAGVSVPRFCYHDRLSISGNCRMCLVEIAKAPKPAASCAMPVMPDMQVYTDTPLVRTAREGVMEFLLANHPLDCPICDQGGECDLQDQSMQFGSDRSRFKEIKRAVEDKDLGPVIKTTMTRCIHCTRCVRYTTEVAGVTDMGTTGRGNQMEIGTYVNKVLDTEMAGNAIDLCPVGALTAKPLAFQFRSWELESTESIDVSDAVGCNIRVDTRGAEIQRILPRLNEAVNEEWISDKARYYNEGLRVQRLDTPMLKDAHGQLQPATWTAALTTIRDRIAAGGGAAVRGVVGNAACAESIIALKDFLNRIGCEDVRAGAASKQALPCDTRAQYLLSDTIDGFDDAQAVLVVGSNPRMEAAVLNSRIRKQVRARGLAVGVVGPAVNLGYTHEQLGDSTAALAALGKQVSSGKGKLGAAFADPTQAAMILVGAQAVEAGDGGRAVYEAVHAFAAHVNAARAKAAKGGTTVPVRVNVLHSWASRGAVLDLGIGAAPVSSSTPKVVYLLGHDELGAGDLPAGAFVVYQGHQGDAGASAADVILPGAAYTEKTATYVNTEGRVQRTQRAGVPPGEAREDWTVLRALSEMCGVPLPYDSLEEVRDRLVDVAPHFASVDRVEVPSVVSTAIAAAQAAGPAPPRAVQLLPTMDNYWFTDPVSRASKTMANCAAQLKVATNSYTGSNKA